MNSQSVNDELLEKLKSLPRSAGVYFHKDTSGEIIYVGKAAVLKNRVRQYFQSTRDMDVKTRALVAEINDTDWIETDSEIDALFLESEMVKRYMPRFNILLRDDKSQLYIRIDMKSEWPFISYTRNPADDGAEYFGPYYNAYPVKKALRYLRRVFPYYLKPPSESRALSNLDVHIGLSPAMTLSSADYKTSLRKLIRYIKGERQLIIKELEADMKRAARSQEYEAAAHIRNRLRDLKELQRRIMFGDKEFMDISKDQALSELRDVLTLAKTPTRIEGYDISHMSGRHVVASMVVFTNGTSDRSEYRKFKTKIEHNDDFYNMNETISRRLSSKNVTAWGVPDIMLIDGGKGQLDAATKARRDSLRSLEEPLRTKVANIHMIGLAKREEQIVIHHERSVVTINNDVLAELGGRKTVTDEFTLLNIPHNSHIIKLVQRIRDESHRFAVSYHTVLKRQKQTSSNLEDIAGIGPATRRRLLKHFKSLTGIRSASLESLTDIVGKDRAEKIKLYFGSDDSSKPQALL